MKFLYTGMADEMLRFVEKEQLKDKDLWKLVAEQFEGTPDDADLGWRGEYWGKLMRGACMTYQYTEDAELYDMLTEAVNMLLNTQETDGRISTYSRTEEFQGWDMWSRKYVLLGLIHFYEICKDEEMKKRVLEAAERHLDYIIAHVGKEEGKKEITKTSDLWRGINSSSILEPVVRLYQLSAQKEYLDFASYIVENGGADGFNIFEAAYENKLYPYQYPVVKAYELMSCFEGLIEYYKATGIEKWRIAAQNFMDRLLESEATVVGGSGCEHELFNHSTLMQTYSLYDGLMLETCVTVTWMKLLYRIYELTGDCKYMDAIECSVYNALYGAVNTENSTCGSETTFDEPHYRQVYDRHVADRNGKGQIFDSYSPLRSGIRGRAVGGMKPMRDNTTYCGCCVAIGAAGTALVPVTGAEIREEQLRLGMYLPGIIQCTINDVPVELEVKTVYPADGNVSIIVKPEKETEFSIALRIPAFAEHSTVTVNGQAAEGTVTAGAFFVLTGKWSKGDEIRLVLDMKPRLAFGEKNPEDPESEKHVAVLYGPLALARDKRIGVEGVPVSVTEGKLSLKPMEKCPVPCQCAFEVELDGQNIAMLDYASAGKTWRRDSEMEVWMRMEY